MPEKVSIIIPAYNASQTLRRCVASVLKQTLQDFHIYIVDDCSMDETWQLMQCLAEEDSRISIYRQHTNQGPAAARNFVLDIVRGEWLYFIDSDDEISSNFLDAMITEGERTGKEMVLGSIKKINIDGTVLTEWVAGNKYITDSPEQTLQVAYGEKDDLEFMMNLLWTKIYRHRLFCGVKLPVGRLQEDAFIMPYLIYNSNTGVAVATDACYFYYDNASSVSHQAQNGISDLKRREDLLYLYEHHIMLYKQHGNTLFYRSRLNYLNNVISIYHLHYESLGHQCADDFKQIHLDYKRHFKEAIKEHNPYLSWQLCLVLMLFVLSPSLYMRIFRH